MEREYTIVLAAGVIALALSGASRAEAPRPGAAILDNGIEAMQQHFPLGSTYSDKRELPALTALTADDHLLLTPSFTDRADPAMICACAMPNELLQSAPLVG